MAARPARSGWATKQRPLPVGARRRRWPPGRPRSSPPRLAKGRRERRGLRHPRRMLGDSAEGGDEVGLGHGVDGGKGDGGHPRLRRRGLGVAGDHAPTFSSRPSLRPSWPGLSRPSARHARDGRDKPGHDRWSARAASIACEASRPLSSYRLSRNAPSAARSSVVIAVSLPSGMASPLHRLGEDLVLVRDDIVDRDAGRRPSAAASKPSWLGRGEWHMTQCLPTIVSTSPSLTLTPLMSSCARRGDPDRRRQPDGHHRQRPPDLAEADRRHRGG